eukprot:gnl/MRDRNA2_/MRDRNA2_267071_c0_seq1.p1 gnl/MRDRNA2_/MRDRNA2_267071_c0~~gnl/MRDRNA2_/MRDRNA2_267071_c0_seq1.p1  ORF type:complete len:135 (-),score=13.50 gnl/MRDRNA2_/MRDRNA2_267071_c0_seq1:1-405(-)
MDCHYTEEAPPAGVHYHVRTIGPPPDTPVSTLVHELGHSGQSIDVFKIDCEGCEWDTYKSWFGADVYIRQILVELHRYGDGKAHMFFKDLFDMGYVIFHKEPNIQSSGVPDMSHMCVEMSLLNLSLSFSRGYQF